MKKTHLVNIVFLGLSLAIPEVISASDFNPDSIAPRLQRQLAEYPQESIHITTDQGVYLAGDTIWMRPFVVNASTLQQSDASRYVYVELAAPTGEVVRRITLLGRDGRFKGYLPLDLDLPEGQYTLSAYTTFMRNMGPDFFFRKKVSVLSPYAMKEGFEVSSPKSGTIRLDRTNVEVPIKIKADDKERILKKDDRLVDISLNKGEKNAGTILVSNGQYSRYINVGDADTTIAVSFHPEGGYLIPGENCKVGVKAIGPDGLSRDISGIIVDSKGRNVANFSTIHAGMGSVTIRPEAGETYTFRTNGNSYRLPDAESNAAVIHAEGADTPGVPIVVKAIGRVPAGCTLVAQTRGQLIQLSPIALGSPVSIDRTTLPTGVTQLLLIDPSGNTLSERLIWNN